MNLGMMRRRPVEKIENYLMTTETNPKVLSVCYAQGWCANPNYMTFAEAAKVTNIGTAFAYNTEISHFEELEYFGIKSIPVTAFRTCPALAKIKLPNGITSIEQRAFTQCSALVNIDIPNSVTTIGNDCFTYCSKLTKVTIGTGIKTISTWALATIGALRNVTIRATVPPNIASNTFSSSGNAIFYVPESSVAAYKAKANWSALASRIQAIPS